MNSHTGILGQANRWLRRRLNLLTFALFLGLLSSCNSDADLKSGWSDQTVDKTISVNVLQNRASGAVDANSSDFESRLNSMHVLVFLPKDNSQTIAQSADLLFYNMARVSNLGYDPTSKKQTFDLSIQIPHDSDRLRLVFVANARSLNVDNLRNKTLADISDEMDFTVFDGDDYVWDMTNKSVLDTESLPMSGYLDASISELDKLEAVDISLFRAVTRVDIGFGYSVNQAGEDVVVDNGNVFEGKSYFIKSIYAYRITERGLAIAPDPVGLNLPSATQNSNIPYVVKLENHTARPIKQKLYLPENLGGLVSAGDGNLTTFVVGIYNNDFTSADKVRYYKINRKKDIGGESAYESLIRNKRIVFGINEVIGDGYRTPEEALKGEADLNATITVTDWVDELISVGGQGGYPGFKWKAKVNADTEHYHSLSEFDLGKNTSVSKEIYIYGGAIPEPFKTDDFKLEVKESLSLDEENLWIITVSKVDSSRKFSVTAFLKFSNQSVPIYIFNGEKSLRPLNPDEKNESGK